MPIQPDMVGYVVRDMAATLRFYRLLGLDIPTGVEAEPFVEVITPNGYRLSWNTEAMVCILGLLCSRATAHRTTNKPQATARLWAGPANFDV